MGLLDSVVGALGAGRNAGNGGGQGDLLQAVMGLVGNGGLEGNDVAGQLSQLLPQVVDKLTPGGHLPAGGLGGLGDIGGLLGSLMRR